MRCSLERYAKVSFVSGGFRRIHLPPFMSRSPPHTYASRPPRIASQAPQQGTTYAITIDGGAELAHTRRQKYRVEDPKFQHEGIHDTNSVPHEEKKIPPCLVSRHSEAVVSALEQTSSYDMAERCRDPRRDST